jgi:tRNA dimethylallyltransferase
MTTVRVICGPTGAGKSALALSFAARMPCTIVSADSRQLYRGFDVGTAKPTSAERGAVPHRGIDVADPVDRYSAARWAESADAWIEEALRQDRTPIVVGGTGLYLRSLFEGLFVEPDLEPERRRALDVHLRSLATDELRRWVRELDPPRVHLGRTQLLRAIEIAFLTGEPISALHRQTESARRWVPRYLVVDPGPVLREWNERRTDRMLETGWIDEVKELMGHIPEDAPAWNATGYRVLRRLVSGERDASSAREEIVTDTRQYVKRQRTWFRHQLPSDAVSRVDPSSASWMADADAWWQAVEASGSQGRGHDA